MRNMVRKVFLAVIVLLFMVVSVFALEVPQKPAGRVNDYAGLFSAETVNDISAQLSRFEEQTTNQIVVATFPSLEGESLEDFSIRLAEQWKVGQKGKDNGVIILVFRDDRAVRIETGYGVEAVLTDVICSKIIFQIIVPHFKNGDYDTGIKQAVTSIMSILQGGELPESSRPRRKEVSSILPFLIIVIFVILRAILFSGINQRLGTHRHRGGGFWSGGFGGGGFGGGGGGFSGGGGSFGGGGASGRW